MDYNSRMYGGSNEKVFEPAIPIAQAMQDAGGAVEQLRREMPQYDAATQAMLRHLKNLSLSVDIIQSHCAVVMQERDQYSTMLTATQLRLTEVQRVVQRYTVVQEPVVASDGFTYERRTMKQYFDDCARTNAVPVSQQTREELTNALVPNQSLKKLVDLLKAVKADNPALKDDGARGAGKTLGGEPHHHHHAGQGAAAGSGSGGNPYARGQMINDGRLHPCIRVYGFCNYKETCTYASYPYDACLSFLKGKCRFGPQCHELHVDFRRPKKEMTSGSH